MNSHAGSRRRGHHDAWNKGKLVGQKAPFKLKEIWSIRVRLEMQGGFGNSRSGNKDETS